MEEKEIKQQYIINTNEPIYQYHTLSYCFKDSDENDDEVFSYSINDKKIEALRDQKIKNESKIKNFKNENKMVLSKSQMNINLFENHMEKRASTSLMTTITKKKKIDVKKKRIKMVNNNAPIHISPIETKELENDSDKIDYNIENFKNEEDTPEKNPLIDSFTKDNDCDISDKINEYDNKLLSHSETLFIMKDFSGLELDDQSNNNNSRSKNDFIFDEKKLKKNKSQKKIKTIKKKKKHIENKINQVNIDEQKIKEDNNNNDITNFSLSNEDIKEFKIIDDVNNKENNEDESNNISTSNNNSNVDSKNNKLRNSIELQNDNQETVAVKIQSIWRAHQMQKRIKFTKIVKYIIDKLSLIIKNKISDDYSYFIGKISDRKKSKNIKIKSKKHSKKVKGLNSLIPSMDSQELNELIEKEKKYDLLLAKYEEVMKELEKFKKENEDEIAEKNNNFNNLNSKVYEQYTKINEISNIKIISKKKHDSNNFVINRNINVQILNIKQEDNILFDKKYFSLYKIFNKLNEKNKFNMRNYFDKYKSIVNSLNCVDKYIKFEKATRKRNLAINLVKSFSINKIENRSKSKSRKIKKLKPKKSIKKKLSNSNITKSINSFNESKLVINKIISKFNIIQKNNIYDKYNNLVITKLENKFNIKSKKKSDFLITKALNDFKISDNIGKGNTLEKGKLFISEESQLMIKKSFKKNIN